MASTSFYDPDPGALARGVSFIQFLSQRDLGLQTPLNYVTAPGVSVTSACFSHHVYENIASAKCFSNILAVGFQRLDIDVYWDVTLESWSLCPVQLGDPADTTLTQASSITHASALTSSVSFGTSDASGVLDKRQTATANHGLVERQDLSSSTRPVSSLTSEPTLSFTTVSVSDASNTTPISPSTSTTHTQSPSPTTSGSALQVIGPYTCSKSTNLELFLTVLSAHLGTTQRDTNASINYLVFNVHAASSAADPTGSADQPPSGTLPQNSNLLSQVLLSSTSGYIYTPSRLESERANLNSSETHSWFDVPTLDQPDPAYFQVDHSSDGGSGDVSTPNGWPGEGFAEQRNFRRLLAGFGQIDPQMAGYNFTADQDDIFGQEYISSETPITYTTDGSVSGGCFYRPNMPVLDASTNSSWAVKGLNTTISSDILYALASNLTSCGISPILNQTLSNTTADQDYRPYQSFINSTMWVWQPGQPANSSRNPDEVGQCAALNSTNFRFQQEDCSDQHYAACRVAGLPYVWQISRSQASYGNADDGCGDNSSFAVPRTALENTYLGHTWQAYRSANTHGDNVPDELLWVDFNDLDIESCWVIGQNTTCSYISDAASETKEIVVPVVAAIIVFVLTLLTLFVKCAGNRRISKVKRKRGMDGWDYEGVPS